jgi:hypothetical protein
MLSSRELRPPRVGDEVTVDHVGKVSLPPARFRPEGRLGQRSAAQSLAATCSFGVTSGRSRELCPMPAPTGGFHTPGVSLRDGGENRTTWSSVFAQLLPNSEIHLTSLHECTLHVLHVQLLDRSLLQRSPHRDQWPTSTTRTCTGSAQERCSCGCSTAGCTLSARVGQHVTPTY